MKKKTESVASRGKKIKKTSIKATVKKNSNLENLIKPSLNRIVASEKKEVKKLPAVRRKISQKSFVVDLKRPVLTEEKIERMFQPEKNLLTDSISVRNNVVRSAASQMEEGLAAQENRIKLLNESTPKRKIAFLFFTVILFVGLFNLVIKYKYDGAETVANNFAGNGAADNKNVGEIAIHEIDLPQNENPTIATVIDGDKFGAKHFFSKAKGGDKVLIYTQANLAILYRPATHKIVESISLIQADKNVGMNFSISAVEKVLADENSSENETSSKAPKEFSVAVYNGSKIKGLAASLADRLARIDGIKIVKKTNATGDFEKNLVIDLTGQNAESAKMIAQAINGEVAQLPAGEAVPKADILVIGANEGTPPFLL